MRNPKTAFVIKLGQRYFYKFGRIGQAQTAWSLAGAKLYQGNGDERADIEKLWAADKDPHMVEVCEGFKTTVINRTIPIEGKGVEEVTGDNRANGMIVPDHVLLGLLDEDRRYFVAPRGNRRARRSWEVAKGGPKSYLPKRGKP